jgi:hypothetical protein
MQYEVISGGPANTAPETVKIISDRSNEAIRSGASVAGGMSIVNGRAPGIWAREAYEAFQAVLYLD